MTVYSGTSHALSILSGRLSYMLGLIGPCVALDTACSSSLVTVWLSLSSLNQERCPCALAVSVGLITVGITNLFSIAGMLSNAGRCHTFDVRADGYCRGEGSTAFILDNAFRVNLDDVRQFKIRVGGTAV